MWIHELSCTALNSDTKGAFRVGVNEFLIVVTAYFIPEPFDINARPGDYCVVEGDETA